MTTALRMRMAASNTFSPLSLSPVAWYDFSDAATLFTDAGTTPVSADGDAIYQANDKSGNARHLTQVTAGSRPLYKTGILSARSLGRFDGTDDYLQTAAFGALAQPLTYFVVFKTTTVAAPRYFVSGAAASRCELYIDNVGPQYGADAGSGLLYSGLTPDTDYHIISILWNNTTNALREDGVAGTGTSPGTQGTTKFTLGAYFNGILPLNGDIAEFIAYNAALSTADHNLVGRYAAYKYGLTWTTVT